MIARARDIMTKDVVTAPPDASIKEVAGLLIANRISAVPVCDSDAHVLGLISESDLLNPLSSNGRTQRDWWLSRLAEGEPLAPEFVGYVQSNTDRARDLMSAPVVFVSPDAGAPQIAETLLQHNIKRVPVIENGKLIGIVSRADLVRLIGQSPQLLLQTG